MRLVLAGAVLFVTVRLLLLFSSDSLNGFRFIDTAAQAGIRTQMVCGGVTKKQWIPEANGSGAAWLDYDNDGWMDLLIVNGATMEQLVKIVAGHGSPSQGGVYLYRNLRNGRFEDVTAKSGLTNPYWGTGANATDYNNDGHTDILITTIGLDLLYKNNGNGTFSETGKAAGLSRSIAWHTGSGFGDYDSDGHPDLYVAGYVNIGTLPLTQAPPACDWKGFRVFCGPMGLRGERDILYHNNGDGTFTDVTQAAGVEDSKEYHGFAAVFQDFDGDGKADIFVANDSDPNYLYLNSGDGTFKESALVSGVAMNADGQPQANMGVALGDYDNDSRIDLLTTTFDDAHFPLFKQVQPGFYEDVSNETGLGTTTIPYLGWACGFADLDNEGTKELWLANGHVYPDVKEISGKSFFQPFVVFQNRSGKFLRALSYPSKPDNSYRGGCSGDFDNDGKVDILLTPLSGSPVLLTNRSGNENAWIGLALKGRQSNRDALGAQIRVEACGKVQYDWTRNADSYLSRKDPRLHFGLGRCSKVSRISITWPRGKVQVLTNLSVNQYISVEEPL